MSVDSTSMWFIGAPVTLALGDDADLPAGPALVPTRPNDRHVTLVFLGRAPQEDVLGVWTSVPELELPPVADGLGWERFGRSAIALVVSDGSGRLAAAAAAGHEAADGRIEVRPPSPFRPHVTMARVPRRARPPSTSAMRAWTLPAAPIEVGPLTLFRSRPDASGDRYEVVEQRPRR